MLKLYCDGPKCEAPIEPGDNHIEINAMVIVDKGRGFQIKPVAFCGKGCLNKFLDQATQQPLIVSPHNAN